MPNGDSTEPVTVDPRVAGPRVFDLLANEVRFRIVRELHTEDGGPIPFSRLRERVEVADSGRFNYHLRKLEGDLVAKCAGGYALTATGRAFAALVAPEPAAHDAISTE